MLKNLTKQLKRGTSNTTYDGIWEGDTLLRLQNQLVRCK